MVGIQHPELQRFVEAFCSRDGKNTDRMLNAAAFVSQSLYGLLPGGLWHEWMIDESAPAPATDAMMDAVEEYGEPYMRELTTQPGLLTALAWERRGPTRAGVFAYPVVLAMLGRPAEAEDVIAGHLRQLYPASEPGEPNAYNVQYELFAKNCRAWIAEGAPPPFRL